jgi:MFS family permease
MRQQELSGTDVQQPSSRGIFYGWWITAASALILFITVGIGLYAPPVFMVPLQDHFGWSRATIAAGSSVAALTTGLISPIVGFWIDRYGARKVMSLGALLMAGSMASFAAMESLWQLYVINMLAAIGLACTAWIPNQTLISNWFRRRRGLAMGISLAGIGLGGLTFAPLADLLIMRLGWRLAFAGLASLILAIAVAVVLAVVRSRPADLGLLPDGDETPGDDLAHMEAEGADGGASGLELRESLRTSAFWTLSLCNFLSVFASFSIVVHLVAFLGDQGLERTAAGSLGLTIGVSVGGRLFFGLLADRLTTARVMSVALILLAGGTLFLFVIRSGGALPGFVIMFGLAFGGTAVLLPLLVGECFGLRSFGRILGLIMIPATLGAAIGPILTGRIYDVTGSYRLAFILHIAALASAALAIYFLRPPQHPVRPVTGAQAVGASQGLGV